jgi:hypothetical protein
MNTFPSDYSGDTCVYYAGENDCVKRVLRYKCPVNGDYSLCGLIDLLVDGERRVYATKLNRKTGLLPHNIIELFTTINKHAEV